VSATATDKAGNTASASTTYTVIVAPAGLCRLIVRLVGKPQLADSLCSCVSSTCSRAARRT
jgi:hypothetical protein